MRNFLIWTFFDFILLWVGNLGSVVAGGDCSIFVIICDIWPPATISKKFSIIIWKCFKIICKIGYRTTIFKMLFRKCTFAGLVQILLYRPPICRSSIGFWISSARLRWIQNYSCVIAPLRMWKKSLTFLEKKIRLCVQPSKCQRSVFLNKHTVLCPSPKKYQLRIFKEKPYMTY